MIPQVRRWLTSKTPSPVELIEPFAGGAIVGLTCAFERLTESVMLLEKDEDVAAVWRTILNPQHGPWLADRIASFEFSPDAVRAELAAPRWKLNNRERAFKTILRNRVQRGGILAPGAGLIKAGENGRGMASRWYPETLRKRIMDITEIRVRSRINFIEGDGLAAIRENIGRNDVAFFIDPPYTVAGSRLYTYSEIDHQELFTLMSETRGDFLMTYDDTAYIRKLAQDSGFQMRQVAMKNSHHAKMTELLIGRNLDWVPEDPKFLEATAEAQASLEFEIQTSPC